MKVSKFNGLGAKKLLSAFSGMSRMRLNPNGTLVSRPVFSAVRRLLGRDGDATSLPIAINELLIEGILARGGFTAEELASAGNELRSLAEQAKDRDAYNAMALANVEQQRQAEIDAKAEKQREHDRRVAESDKEWAEEQARVAAQAGEQEQQRARDIESGLRVLDSALS